MSTIPNIKEYNSAMKKSLLDKIFFMDKVEATVFVDYGCADGTLISFLHSLFPEFMFFGFDISEDMIKIAKTNNPDIADNFSTDWDYIKDQIAINGHIKGNKTAVILSSILHEVYSYGTSKDVEDFWNNIWNEEFNYVSFRDMMPSRTLDKQSEINDVLKIYRKANTKDLYDFERNWGSIENNKNLMHFLLKYRYSANWSREVKENYFPVNREELLSNLPTGYEIIFHEHFILPFLKNRVKEDFDIDIKDNTHLKLILRRK